MFKRSVCHLGNCFVGSQTVGFNDNRLALALGRIQQWPELLDCDSLLPEIDGRGCAAGNADDLLLVCGPSVKRENGIETEIPGCKIKFELSNRKKTRRKTTSTSANRTSQPKLYSFVRLSFMKRCSNCRFTESSV